MSHRLFALVGVLAIVIAAIWLVPASGTAGQGTPVAATTRAAADAWTSPRTPWGEPDLHGIWDFRTITPLERPREFAAKEVLSDEEAAEFEKRTNEINNRDRRDGAGSIEVGPDGRTDVARAYNEFWWDRGTKIIGSRRTSLVVDPPDGRIPPLTPEAQKREAARAEARERPAHGPEDRSVGERCMLGFNAGPPMLPSAYNNNVQLLQIPGYVVIFTEMVHDARIVPLDGRPHLPRRIRQWKGDSRGRWEGNTLVVDTQNFYDTTSFRGSSPNMHLVERFTRVDADTLLYEFTVADETTWTRPWTAQVPMTKAEGLIFEYACHEGNYGMFNLLAGARAADKAEAEAAKKSR